MIKGNWYRETQRPDDLFFRYFERNKHGYLIFDKQVGGNLIDAKLIHGYQGMERFLVPANKDEIKRFKLF